MKQLTVQEIIDKLQKVEDKTMPVILGGCDCTGEAGQVAVWNGDVWIERIDNMGGRLPEGWVTL